MEWDSGEGDPGNRTHPSPVLMRGKSSGVRRAKKDVKTGDQRMGG